MANILVVEPSATLRAALKKHLEHNGYEVTACAQFESALTHLNQLAKQSFDGIAIGWPSKTDELADEVFARLESTQCQHLAVLILAHESVPATLNWVSGRPNTGLLIWSDYAEAPESITRLLYQAHTKPKSPGDVSDKAAMTPHQLNDIRILFVDDSPTVRVSFRKLLSKNGYEVETAASVAEGMELALESSFDIAIIDYFMPDDTGDVLVKQLRNHPQTQHITAAILTGTYLDQVIKDSLKAGAVECMFKNEANELFLARIEAMSRNIATHKRVDKERKRLNAILSSVGDGVYGVDTEGRLTFINPAARRLLGFSADEPLKGQPAHDLIHHSNELGASIEASNNALYNAYQEGEKLQCWEAYFWDKEGKNLPVECTVYPLNIDNEFVGSVVAFRDVSERKLLEKELRWQATHDPLTKLLNRFYFEQQLEAEVARVHRNPEQKGALLYLDLDRFKYINDTIGHAAGDELLVEIGHQLLTRLRQTDLLARLGGDEFAIILRQVEPEQVLDIAEEFRQVLSHYRFHYRGKNYDINGSIGAAIIDETITSAGVALANADMACHVAKGKGRNQTHLFTQDGISHNMDQELGWSTRLKDALDGDLFKLVYHPIIKLSELDMDHLPDDSGELWQSFVKTHDGPIHYEVLLRFIDSSESMISPHAFIPTAERFNLMGQIDRWVLTNALETLAQVNKNSVKATFSINLSGQTITDETLGPWIIGKIRELKIAPRTITFEITETSAIENLDSAKGFIRDIQSIGCRFALDDFGSGFCSFSHMKHLPVDYIKIDGLFIQGIANDPMDRAIVSSVNKIAHSMGKSTVAEYVENREILRSMHQFGVDYVQGYYISYPLETLPHLDIMPAHATIDMED